MLLPRNALRIAVALAALVVTACASDRDPAEKALKAAEDAIASVRADAEKFVPDQLRSVDDALKSARDSFAKGDYKAVLAAAPDISAKAQSLSAAASAKKAELAAKQAEMTKSWEQMSEGLPKVVQAIQSRVDILSHAKKLPAGLDKAAVDGAKTGLEEINKAWGEAQDAFKAGNMSDALAKAGMVKSKAAEIMGKLGMEVPEALKS